MGDTGIGALLLRLRKERGWTQQKVADEYNAREGRAAMTGKEIGRYEREVRIPVPYTRRHLAHSSRAVHEQCLRLTGEEREARALTEYIEGGGYYH